MTMKIWMRNKSKTTKMMMVVMNI
ncbi:hypothetical protein BLA29_015474 [Euroglyphus maynei]|uniref:Uncharacterized protein n=1 Tax=Euroglyphus maynei TaxID=6958 RepID=A0A1Y3BS23_EURMA|nr:hypothetical protein BLA29_015474 [Euroglyphus maynei]